MPDERAPDPTIRRAQRVLLMVHELHKQGYQLLRIAPGMSASGNNWRCGVTPRSNTLQSNGALANDFDRVIGYSNAQSNHYFGWEDAETDTARQLAQKFINRFPEVIRESQGEDWEYCGWFVQMLGLADQQAFPVAYADWPTGEREGFLETSPRQANLPLPPPGDVVSNGY